MSRIAKRLVIPTPPTYVTGNKTLTPTDTFVIIQSSGLTVTLPQTTAFPGAEIFIKPATGVTSFTIQAQTGDLLSDTTTPLGVVSRNFTTENILAYSNGSNRWYLSHGGG